MALDAVHQRRPVPLQEVKYGGGLRLVLHVLVAQGHDQRSLEAAGVARDTPAGHDAGLDDGRSRDVPVGGRGNGHVRNLPAGRGLS